MLKQLLIWALPALLITSCNTSDNPAEEHAERNLHTREQFLAEIDSLENLVYNDTSYAPGPEMSQLLQKYLHYSKIFVGDEEKTPEFLYKAAALSRAVELPVKAIKLYNRILEDYPDWEKNPEVAFQIAFTFDADLNEREEARKAYEEVVERYGADPWAEQARERLKTVDMTDEELIEYFKMKAEEEGGV